MNANFPDNPRHRPSDTETLLETQAMLAAIGRIQAQLLTRKDAHAAFDALLGELLRVSESVYGFIGEAVHEGQGSPWLRVHAFTGIAWSDEVRSMLAEKDGLEFRRHDTLLGEVLRTSETVISNSPASDPRSGGLPSGHPPIDAFLGIPFMHGGAMIGMVGLANRRDGYSGAVVEALQPMIDTVRTVIVAFRSERARTRAEAAAIHLNRELKASVEALERLDEDNRVLSTMRDELQACHSIGEIGGVAERFSVSMLGAHCGMLCLFGEDDCLRSEHRWGCDGEPGIDCDQTAAGPEHASLPLMAQGEPMGQLWLAMAEPPPAAPELARRERLASALAMPLSLAIANVRMREMLRDQAMRDPLSGLFNRRYMEEVLDRECRRAVRRGLGMVVFMVDIDHFKRINDGFGHQAGDHVIREVARCLESIVRREDYVFRYGGEEFVLVLADTNAEAMGSRAEAILQAVRRLQLSWKTRELGPISVSIGAAAFPEHGRSPGALLRAADAAMYLAKQSGRDCAVQAALPGRSDA